MKRLLRLLFRLRGYDIVKLGASHSPQNHITRDNFFDLYFSKVNPADFFFVQIGANDGKTNDPLYPYVTKYGLSGVAIEPQPDVYEILKENYKGYPKVRCINAAISQETGTLPFFSVKDSARTPENFSRMTGIASFNKDVLRRTIKNKLPAGAVVDDYIEETLVPALSFSELVRAQKIGRIDFLQIDCEGYDYEILKTVDLEAHSPDIINFESMHLSSEDRAECEAMLAARGYKFFTTRSDTCAYKI